MPSLGNIVKAPTNKQSLGMLARVGAGLFLLKNKLQKSTRTDCPSILYIISCPFSDLLSATPNASTVNPNHDIPVDCLVQNTVLRPHVLPLNNISAPLQSQHSGDHESETNLEYTGRPDLKNAKKIIFRHCLFYSKGDIY